MTVSLMVTCLCDAFYGEVAIATTKVLENCGCTVVFDERQTCCGQPAFNAGDWKSARKVASHWLDVFGPTAHPIVVPSASCAAMVRHGFGAMIDNCVVPELYELSEFLIDQVQVKSWPSVKGPRRYAFHRACHGRGIGLGDRQERLMGMVGGIEWMALEDPDQCCGFGGAFSATHGSISAGIGDAKVDAILDTGAEALVSGDMGCIMHLRGLIEKKGLGLQGMHYAEILAEAIA